MTASKEYKHRHYHKHRIFKLYKEREELQHWFVHRHASATTAAEMAQKEKRLARVNVMLESSALAYQTGAPATANKMTAEILDEALTANQQTSVEPSAEEILAFLDKEE